METTVYRPSVESMAFDSDRSASYQPTASYIRARAARAEHLDDTMPLFLSDPFGEPDPREYTPRALRSRTRIVWHLLATGLVVCGAAMIAASFQSDLRDLVARGLPGPALAVNSTPVVRQVPLKDPARVTNTVLASAEQQQPLPSAPNREAISTAYQIALQARSQAQAPVQIQAPVAPQPLPSEPVRTLDAETLDGLMTRARNLIGVGDLAAARLLLERAANANDATAALLLAQTHDPAVLGTNDARSVIADEAAARGWYQRAASLGSTEARRRLAQLSN